MWPDYSIQWTAGGRQFRVLGVMTPEVVRAPPLRIALAKLAAMIVVGAAMVLFAKACLSPWVTGYLGGAANRAEALYRFKIVMLGAGVFVLGIAAYAGWLGIRVMQQGQWPLPGSFVVRDTPVRHGRWVRARGIMLVVPAALLVADAVGLAVFPYFLPS